jgi:hypothetical protein
MKFQARLNRVAETTHIVYSDDMTVHRVVAVNSVGDEIYVQAADGMIFRDIDVFTLEEAANMERKMLNICRINSIKYND